MYLPLVYLYPQHSKKGQLGTGSCVFEVRVIFASRKYVCLAQSFALKLIKVHSSSQRRTHFWACADIEVRGGNMTDGRPEGPHLPPFLAVRLPSASLEELIISLVIAEWLDGSSQVQ